MKHLQYGGNNDAPYGAVSIITAILHYVRVQKKQYELTLLVKQLA